MSISQIHGAIKILEMSSLETRDNMLLEVLRKMLNQQIKER